MNFISNIDDTLRVVCSR